MAQCSRRRQDPGCLHFLEPLPNPRLKGFALLAGLGGVVTALLLRREGTRLDHLFDGGNL